MATPTVQHGSVVAINYTLTDVNGKVLDSSSGSPLEYLQGHHNIIPGLESELEGLVVGAHKQVVVQPKDGYGELMPDMRFSLPLAEFGGQTPQAGMMVQLETPTGMIMARILGVEGEQVKLDGNHPLAGQVLNFDVEIMTIRPATSEELSHGHPHGPNGHHH